MSTHAPAQVESKQAIELVKSPTPAAFGTLQRKCACGGSVGSSGECPECKKKKALQRRAAGSTQQDIAPPIVHDVLSSSGQSLDAATRAFFEPRFGHNFGNVRIHTDSRASASARAVNALAYTVGPNIVFGAGQYHPHADSGKQLLGHELTHVIQQGGQMPTTRELRIGPTDDAHEREADRTSQTLVSAPIQAANLATTTSRTLGAGASTAWQGSRIGKGSASSAQALVQRDKDDRPDGPAAGCSVPTGCPAGFCVPTNKYFAMYDRNDQALQILAGIAIAVSPRVVPLWEQYIWGGAAPQDLSSQFGTDFTNSRTTADTTDYLVDALKTNLESNPPTFAPGTNTASVDLSSRISPQIAEIGDPNSQNPMDFDVVKEIPGNIAGGIGKDQTTCQAGAKPSPFNDDRTADGTAEVTQNSDDTLGVVPSIEFTVQDTIDLCPGNCGVFLEHVATLPMSVWEASGISGDVPFTVKFPAPPRPFTTAKITPPTPTPTPAPPAPVTGEVTASFLLIRATPSSSATAIDSYPRGTTITILCETTGTDVEGDTTWDKTDRGYVSDRYVNRTGAGKPPAC